MANESQDPKKIENQKKTSNQRKGTSTQSKKKPSSEISIKRPQEDDSGVNLPNVLAFGGAVIAAFGVGDLLDPNVTPISNTAFESWSIIVIGLIIAFVGVGMITRNYLRNKNKKVSKK